MHSYRRHRAWIVRIVCCTLLLALVAPAFRHAAAAPQFTPQFTPRFTPQFAAQFAPQFEDICSASGVRLAPMDGAPAPPKKAHGRHCLACCVHQAAAATGRVQAVVAPAGRAARAIRSAASIVAVIEPPGAAWPRAPPGTLA